MTRAVGKSNQTNPMLLKQFLNNVTGSNKLREHKLLIKTTQRIVHEII